MRIPPTAVLSISSTQSSVYNVTTDEITIQSGIAAGNTSRVVAGETTVESIYIYNDSGLANTISVILNQTTPITIFKAAVAVGEFVVFDYGQWRVYTAAGEIK